MNIKYISLSMLIAFTGTPLVGAFYSDSGSDAETRMQSIMHLENSSDLQYHTAVSMEELSDMQNPPCEILTIPDLPNAIPVINKIAAAKIKETAISMDNLSDTQDWPKKQLTIQDLPGEILIAITELMDPLSLWRMTQINKNFEKITTYVRTNLLLELHEGNAQAALFYAAKNNMPWVIDHLIQREVDIHATNSEGKTALKLAAQAEHDKVVATLLDNGVNYYSNCYTIFNMQYQIFNRKHPGFVQKSARYLYNGCAGSLISAMICIMIFGKHPQSDSNLVNSTTH